MASSPSTWRPPPWARCASTGACPGRCSAASATSRPTGWSTRRCSGWPTTTGRPTSEGRCATWPPTRGRCPCCCGWRGTGRRPPRRRPARQSPASGRADGSLLPGDFDVGRELARVVGHPGVVDAELELAGLRHREPLVRPDVERLAGLADLADETGVVEGV